MGASPGFLGCPDRTYGHGRQGGFHQRDEPNIKSRACLNEILDRIVYISRNLQIYEYATFIVAPFLDLLNKPEYIARHEESETDLEERHVVKPVDQIDRLLMGSNVEGDDETVLSFQASASRQAHSVMLGCTSSTDDGVCPKPTDLSVNRLPIQNPLNLPLPVSRERVP